MFWRNKLAMTHSRLPQDFNNITLQSYPNDSANGLGLILGAGYQGLVCEVKCCLMLASF